MAYEFGEYRCMAGPAVSSTEYGMVAVALAEATSGRIVSWDCAFDDNSHQSDTAAEFVNWGGAKSHFTSVKDSYGLKIYRMDDGLSEAS